MNRRARALRRRRHGSGPAAQGDHQAARLGKRRSWSSASKHRRRLRPPRTIPSKTLRETALALTSFRARTGSVFELTVREDLQVASLMTRMEQVVKAHEQMMGDQLRRDRASSLHGRARFVDARTVEVESVGGATARFRADHFVIATGSKPRTPSDVPVDHEHVLDSDSILSMTYLPKSLTVLGAGVIAAEYASIFAALGTKVTMVDRGARPLGFLDPEIADFRRGVPAHGVALRSAAAAARRSVGRRHGRDEIDDGSECERGSCSAASAASPTSGLTSGDRPAREQARPPLRRRNCRTAVPHVYAAGDVMPALARLLVGRAGAPRGLHDVRRHARPRQRRVPAGIHIPAPRSA
jgi:NAD(P) transhydrogenase